MALPAPSALVFLDAEEIDEKDEFNCLVVWRFERNGDWENFSESCTLVLEQNWEQGQTEFALYVKEIKAQFSVKFHFPKCWHGVEIDLNHQVEFKVERRLACTLTEREQTLGKRKLMIPSAETKKVKLNSCNKSAAPALSDCVICLESIEEEAVSSFCLACYKEFHSDCLQQWLKSSGKCPLCKFSMCKPRGTQPNGVLLIRKFDHPTRDRLPQLSDTEFDASAGFYELNYFIDSDRLSRRQAFLPADKAGSRICALFMEVFGSRLMFPVGNSASNPSLPWGVVNGLVHYKSAISDQGPYSYPDPNYLARVQVEIQDLLLHTQPNADYIKLLSAQ